MNMSLRSKMTTNIKKVSYLSKWLKALVDDIAVTLLHDAAIRNFNEKMLQCGRLMQNTNCLTVPSRRAVQVTYFYPLSIRFDENDKLVTVKVL